MQTKTNWNRIVFKFLIDRKTKIFKLETLTGKMLTNKLRLVRINKLRNAEVLTIRYTIDFDNTIMVTNIEIKEQSLNGNSQEDELNMFNLPFIADFICVRLIKKFVKK